MKSWIDEEGKVLQEKEEIEGYIINHLRIFSPQVNREQLIPNP